MEEDMADDENAPATKKDLTELRSELKGDMAQMEARFDHKLETKFSEFEERLTSRVTEQIRDSQTDILKAFLPWQDSVHTQFRRLEANMGNNTTAIEQRMGILERRLWEIEKRLLMNPPAA